MSGPVIITDDGGPPLIDTRDFRDILPRVRVGRAGESLDEITAPNAHHVFDSGDIISVTVSEEGGSTTTKDDPDMVLVRGNNGSLLTVRVNSAGLVEIDNDSPLQPDVDANTGFLRYAETDSWITNVWVDGGLVLTHNGKTIRVKIKIA